MAHVEGVPELCKGQTQECHGDGWLGVDIEPQVHRRERPKRARSHRQETQLDDAINGTRCAIDQTLARRRNASYAIEPTKWILPLFVLGLLTGVAERIMRQRAR